MPTPYEVPIRNPSWNSASVSLCLREQCALRESLREVANLHSQHLKFLIPSWMRRWRLIVCRSLYWRPHSGHIVSQVAVAKTLSSRFCRRGQKVFYWQSSTEYRTDIDCINNTSPLLTCFTCIS